MVGLHVVHLSKKMQLEADLMLEKAITQARHTKSVKQQQSLVCAKGEGPRQLDKDVAVVKHNSCV